MASGKRTFDAMAAILRERLAAAQRRRDEASDRFDLIIRDIPIGIPQPDGTQRIQRASNQYRAALDEVLMALRTLNDFLGERNAPLKT